MSLRVLSESLNKVEHQEADYVVTTLRELDEKIIASCNRMKSIREEAENVKSQWKSLQEDLEGVTFARYVTNGTMKEQFQKAVNDLKLEYEDAKSTYNHYKELKNKILTEDAELDYDTPVQVSVDSTVEDTPVQVDTSMTDSHVAEVTSLLDSNSTEDILDYLFNEFVPEYGKADTFLGELVRAVMHILFVWKLSSHVFYQDQGIGECGSAAQFLMDNGYEESIVNIIDTADNYTYADDVLLIVKQIARDFISDPDKFTQSNSVDSKSYKHLRILELGKSYDYTIYLPYNVIEGIDNNVVEYSDVKQHIISVLGLSNDVELSDPFNDQTAVQLSHITKDLFDLIDSRIRSTDIFDKFLPEVTPTDDDDSNIEVDDLFGAQSDADIAESVEATNISLTEDVDNMLTTFLKLHDDPENYKNNPAGFDSLYSLFDSYGFSETEDVDTCFLNLSQEDKELALSFIQKHN